MKKLEFFKRHKFVDDYVTVEELNAAGKKIKRAYYNAEYYESELDDKQSRNFKIIAILLGVVSLVCAGVPVSVYFDAMFTSYVILAYIVAIVASVLHIGAGFNLPGKAKPMERSQMHFGYERLKLSAQVNFFLGLYGAAANAVCCFIVLPKKGGSPLETPTISMDILISVMGLVIAAIGFFIIKKIKAARIRQSLMENDWQRMQRQMREKGEEGALTEL